MHSHPQPWSREPTSDQKGLPNSSMHGLVLVQESPLLGQRSHFVRGLAMLEPMIRATCPPGPSIVLQQRSSWIARGESHPLTVKVYGLRHWQHRPGCLRLPEACSRRLV